MAVQPLKRVSSPEGLDITQLVVNEIARRSALGEGVIRILESMGYSGLGLDIALRHLRDHYPADIRAAKVKQLQARP